MRPRIVGQAGFIARVGARSPVGPWTSTSMVPALRGDPHQLGPHVGADPAPGGSTCDGPRARPLATVTSTVTRSGSRPTSVAPHSCPVKPEKPRTPPTTAERGGSWRAGRRSGRPSRATSTGRTVAPSGQPTGAGGAALARATVAGALDVEPCADHPISCPDHQRASDDRHNPAAPPTAVHNDLVLARRVTADLDDDRGRHCGPCTEDDLAAGQLPAVSRRRRAARCRCGTARPAGRSCRPRRRRRLARRRASRRWPSPRAPVRRRTRSRRRRGGGCRRG